MKLIADAVLVVPGRRDDEEQWLFAGIARAFRQDVVQLAVRLGVDFVKDEAGHVETMFCSCFRRKHLIETGVPIVDDPLARRPNLGPAHQSRARLNHLPGHVEDDGRLIPIASSPVDFGTRLVISVQKI